MSATVRKINDWFRNANRYDVNELLEKIILSDRQARIFEMFYLKRGKMAHILLLKKFAKTKQKMYNLFLSLKINILILMEART